MSDQWQVRKFLWSSSLGCSSGKWEASGLTPTGNNSFFCHCRNVQRIVINFHSKNILRNILINILFTFWPKCCLLIVYLTVLWGHSTCLVGGYVIYQSWLFLSLCCYAMLLHMCCVINTIHTCMKWWSHHMTSLGKHYKRRFQFLVYHRECWFWTEYICYSVCLR